MTVETYAKQHRLNPETVRRYIRQGKIPAAERITKLFTNLRAKQA